jgi:hypothetical protein
MSENSIIETTDSWSFGEILKYVLLPKPKGSPKAGKKEIALRLVMAGFSGLIALQLFFGGKSLPSCDQSESTKLVGQIVNDLPLVKAANVQYVSLKNITEQGHNKEADLRSCSATLVTTAGEDDLQYSIKWQNKKDGTFYVEAQIVN